MSPRTTFQESKTQAWFPIVKPKIDTIHKERRTQITDLQSKIREIEAKIKDKRRANEQMYKMMNEDHKLLNLHCEMNSSVATLTEHGESTPRMDNITMLDAASVDDSMVNDSMH